MSTLHPPPHYSVFVDTSAVFSNAGIVQELPDSIAGVARMTYYVPELAIEERARQLMDDFEDGRRKLSKLGVSVSIEPLPDASYFRNLIEAKLKSNIKLGYVEIVPPVPLSPVNQRMLFEARFDGKYKDTVLFELALDVSARKTPSNWIFLTRDKGFSELARILGGDKQFELQTLVDWKERLKFDQSVYQDIVEALRVSLQERGRSLPAELLQMAARDRGVFGPDSAERLAVFGREDFDINSISVEFRDLSVAATDGSPIPRSKPTSVAWSATVRLSLRHQWGRLYFAGGSATLNWDERRVSSVELGALEMNWRPFA
jgi:hypothetical protein